MPVPGRYGPCARPRGAGPLPAATPAAAEPGGALAALWRGLVGAPGCPSELYLRFERGRRLRGEPTQVAVLVSWEARRVRAGEAQALVELDEGQAGALRRDCRAQGLRFVDNA